MCKKINIIFRALFLKNLKMFKEYKIKKYVG